MQTIRFIHEGYHGPGYGDNYTCSLPGDRSGEYVRADVVERLVEECQHVLRILDLQTVPQLGGWNWPVITRDLRVAIAAAEAP